MLDRRVVITGLGVVSSLGCELPAFWSALCDGRSGIRQIQSLDTRPFVSSLGGEVQGFDALEWIPWERAIHMSRATQFMVSSTLLALSNAGLHRPFVQDIGVCIATGLAGMKEWINGGGAPAQPHTRLGARVTRNGYENVSEEVARSLETGGVCETHMNGCGATVGAIGRAFDLIRLGHTNLMVAGGVDTPFSPDIFQMLQAADVLAPDGRGQFGNVPRPFDRARRGMVVGEGAGCVVLEEHVHAMARGARIYAEIEGWGSTSDPSSLGRLVGSEEEQAQAMSKAMKMALWFPEELDYVNAAGFGLMKTDVSEARAIKRVAGSTAPHLVVSSLKGALGHAFGASGAFQVIGTALGIADGVIPPTLNLTEQDSECDLDVVSLISRRHRIRKALVNSFGFGCSHAALALSHVSSNT